MTPSGGIRISIIDDTSRRDCDADCGTDWSSPEVVGLAARQIESRFGPEATLEYRDLSQDTSHEDDPQLRRTIRENGLSVPLLLVNGHLRVAGQFDTRRVIDAVEADLEIGT
jgi:hypothetical protein